MSSRILLASLAATLLLTPAAPAATAAEPATTSEVTSHSYLADVVRDPSGKDGAPSTQRLVLVSPTGETTTVYERRISRTYGGFRLLDWSADGRTALLTTTERDGARAIRVDVATGAVQEVRVRLLQTALLTPDGSGVLVSRWEGRNSGTLVLERVDWTGTRTRLREGVGTTLVAGRGDTVITAGGRGTTQLVLSTADGSVVGRFGRRSHCSPVRWWDATRLLTWCGAHADLFLVDPATDAWTRLTREHGRGDYGHLDGRMAGDRLYVQVGGGCGYTFIGRRTDRGAVKHLRVPGATGSVDLVDTVGRDLVIEHTASCEADRQRSVLSRFDPVHHEETPLVVLRRNEDLGRILASGEVRASAY